MPSHLRIVAQGRGARDLLPHPNDVVCLPKRYCSDTEGSQPPLLILPHAFLSRLAGTQPLATRPITQVKLKKRRSWVDLAGTILQQANEVTEKTQRSVQYLLSVGRGSVPPPDLPPLPWHDSAKPEHLLDIAGLQSIPLLLPVAQFKANLKRA